MYGMYRRARRGRRASTRSVQVPLAGTAEASTVQAASPPDLCEYVTDRLVALAGRVVPS